MTLLDHKGNPVSSGQFKKAPGPKTGSPYTRIFGPDAQSAVQVPSGATVQFNLDNLTVKDFRTMTSHYQVNASLAVLSFMQHQSDWHIECSGPDAKSAKGKAVAEECEEQLRRIWTPLNRSLSTANWAGYSPNIVEWENDSVRGRMVIDKIKDLVPEACEPHWKEIDAWMPSRDDDILNNVGISGVKRVTPKVKIYDGIDQVGSVNHTPVDNTFWYPMLMENGNYWGRKLLKAAFQPWYFSILIHLFANRYYERFGEPLVVGRAPFDDFVTLPGSSERISGIDYMLRTIKDLRSKSAVTLPNERTEMSSGRFEFDYNMEYLESQMRGADFGTYLTRLDEEISIGLFTPILLLRTADVGSYNLGVGHMQMYLWMLNAMNDDRAQYIDRYILARIRNFNFGPNAPTPHIKFRKLGNQNADVVKEVVTGLMTKGALKFDIREVGEILGMSVTEIAGMQEAKPETTLPASDDTSDGGDPESKRTGGDQTAKPRATAKEVTARVRGQVEKMFRDQGKINPGDKIDMGYFKKMKEAFMIQGVDAPITVATDLYGNMSAWMNEAAPFASSADDFMGQFGRVFDAELTDAIGY